MQRWSCHPWISQMPRSTSLTSTCQRDGTCPQSLQILGASGQLASCAQDGPSAVLQKSGSAQGLLGRRLVNTVWLSFWASTWSEVDSNQRAGTLGALDRGFLEREERVGFLEQGSSQAPRPEAEGWPTSQKLGLGLLC